MSSLSMRGFQPSSPLETAASYMRLGVGLPRQHPVDHYLPADPRMTQAEVHAFNIRKRSSEFKVPAEVTF